MSNTSIWGPYLAPTATNLTQSVTRGASIVSIAPIVLTPSVLNFTRAFTMTFTISGSKK